MNSGQKVALVLCGGGSRGALEAGFYRALLEIGVTIDFIAGSSVGALNGAFIAAGVSADEICRLWRGITFHDLFRFRLSSLLHLRRADSIYDNSRLRRLLERLLPVSRFEDLQTPLTILATDLETGEGVLLERGDLIQATLASVAIPGLLPPALVDGRQLIDGSIANNLPLDVAMEKGANTILAIRCRCEKTRSSGPIHGIVNILSRSFDITDALRYRQAVRSHDNRSRMMIIQPCFDFDVGLLDFDHTAELLRMAYEATMQERAALAPLLTDRPRAEQETGFNT